MHYEYWAPLHRIMQRCEMHSLIILEMAFNYRIDIRDYVPQMDEKCASNTIADDKLIHIRARPVKKNALLHLLYPTEESGGHSGIEGIGTLAVGAPENEGE